MIAKLKYNKTSITVPYDPSKGAETIGNAAESVGKASGTSVSQAAEHWQRFDTSSLWGEIDFIEKSEFCIGGSAAISIKWVYAGVFQTVD